MPTPHWCLIFTLVEKVWDSYCQWYPGTSHTVSFFPPNESHQCLVAANKSLGRIILWTLSQSYRERGLLKSGLAMSKQHCPGHSSIHVLSFFFFFFISNNKDHKHMQINVFIFCTNPCPFVGAIRKVVRRMDGSVISLVLQHAIRKRRNLEFILEDFRSPTDQWRGSILTGESW